jgi:excinuclease UvrABC nuclease subunit
LLKHFKSVKKIKETGQEEIAALIGEAKAKLVTHHFSG